MIIRLGEARIEVILPSVIKTKKNFDLLVYDEAEMRNKSYSGDLIIILPPEIVTNFSDQNRKHLPHFQSHRKFGGLASLAYELK